MRLKVGDKIVRKAEYRDKNGGWKLGGDEVAVVSTEGKSIDIGDGNCCYWDEKYFDLVADEEDAEVIVSNEIQLPGIPDGYRTVRWGTANLGDLYLGSMGVQLWNTNGSSAFNYLIVEKIAQPEPPKPKTRSVVLNRYLVWDECTPCSHRVIVAEEGYVTDNWQNFTLLGHSETIEVEV